MQIGEEHWDPRVTPLPPRKRPAAPMPDGPPTIAVPLPGGHVWRVRAELPPALADEWLNLLRTEAVPFAVVHRQWQLIDLGWTLPCPSPADMPDPSGWHQVPDGAQAAVFEWWCGLIAPVLAGAEQQAV